MKHSGIKSIRPNRLLVALLISLAGICCAINALAANHEKASAAKSNPAAKTRITADRMVSEGQRQYVEFIGTVKVVQDTTVITSDRLKIFYQKKDQKDGSAALAGNHDITRMVATGDVIIKLENGMARTQTAEYDMATQLVTLTGPNSKFTSGESSLSGSKIVFHREKGNIKAESDGQKQVEVVFSTTDTKSQ